MANLTDLSPRSVWEIFEQITRVPRPSKKEGKIVAWLEDFAQAHKLQYRKDVIGNIVIAKPASKGMEGHETVVLQNHVDMVCEKNADARNAQGGEFDFERDAIQTVVTPDGWVKTQGTTLGADNGLGMAAALAVLIDPDAVHPPLEALFTVDEETGLTGAFNLGSDMITGKYLINLDSEDEGEVFIGCAGGVDTLARFDYSTEPAPAAHSFFELSVTGLAGGHSGDDIEKGRGNSNKILARVLWAGIGTSAEATDETATGATSGNKTNKGFGLRLASIDGGNLRNAIPREAHAVVAVPEGRAADFVTFVKDFAADVQGELSHSDPGVTVTLSPAKFESANPANSTPTLSTPTHEKPAPSNSALEKSVPSQSAPITAPRLIDADTTRRLVSALVGVPNGVQAMSFAMPGLVETSSNLASVKIKGNKIVVTTSQRSSVESSKTATAAAVEAVFSLAGARVEHSDGYPGWSPNPDSHLLEITKNAYKKLFGTEPSVRAIHAGLECGLLLEKFPRLEMVSIGPTIRGAHSPDERIEIASVDKFQRLLAEMLKAM